MGGWAGWSWTRRGCRDSMTVTRHPTSEEDHRAQLRAQRRYLRGRPGPRQEVLHRHPRLRAPAGHADGGGPRRRPLDRGGPARPQRDPGAVHPRRPAGPHRHLLQRAVRLRRHSRHPQGAGRARRGVRRGAVAAVLGLVGHVQGPRRQHLRARPARRVAQRRQQPRRPCFTSRIDGEEVSVNADAVRSAAARIAGRVHRTPVRTSATLDGRTGAQVVVKDEAVQKTGSFKARGALNRLLTLPEDALDRGLVGVSAGNHAGALAWAAAQVGAKATVVMPTYAPTAKVAACWGYGAEVVLHGDTTVEAFAECERLQRDRGLTFVHPFDDPEIVAGQGTSGLELVEDAGAGRHLGLLRRRWRADLRHLAGHPRRQPGLPVIGVEPAGAAALTAALAAGKPVPIVPRSVADGLCAPFAGPLTFPLFRELVDELVLVSEAELLAGVRFVMERMKVVVEAAGAAGVAAMLAGKVGDLAGARVGTVLSGGNVDLGVVVPQLPPAD